MSNPKYNISVRLHGVRGTSLSFNTDPFTTPIDDSYTLIKDALIIVGDGRIVDAGSYAALRSLYPQLDEADIDSYHDAVIMPGFVDCHTHYVQAPMIASPGDSLLQWLNHYTFPTEIKFADKEFADEAANVFFRQILSQGTTTANVFATTYAASVEAFFEESERYNTRMICGKVLQDRNLPNALRDRSAEESIEISEELLMKWHNRGRQLYAVIPRFAPTSTPRQLRLAGELYRRHIDSGVYMHTHLDESLSEIDWVSRLFPDRSSYTDVYRHYGLLGPRSIFAHCCIVSDDEWEMLYTSGAGVAHCPSSNLFLGDGDFKLGEAKKASRPMPVGVATDIGGGTNFSVLRQLGETYKVAMLSDFPVDPVRLLYLATLGGASALGLDHCIGRIAPGYEADLAVVNLKPNEFAEWRLRFSSSIPEKIFALVTLGYDNLVAATYVAGKKVW